MTARRAGYLLAGVVLLGLGLRLYALGAESLWLDEISSVVRARMGTEDLLRTVSKVGTNPPGHYLVLNGWLRVFPETEASVRLPSVLFQVGGLWFLYAIGRRLVSRKAALLACLFVAISSYHILLAQEARPHSLLALLTLASMYCLVGLCRAPTKRLSVAYAVTTLGLLYTQPYAVFVWGAQNLFVFGCLIVRPRWLAFGWKRWLVLQAIVGAGFSPWLVIMMRRTAAMQSEPLSTWVPAFVDLPGMFKALCDDNAVLGLGMILLAGYGIYRVASAGTQKNDGTGDAEENRRECARGPVLFLLLAWMAAPLIVPFVISRISSPIFHSRYMIVISFPFYLLAAHGILSLPWRMLGVGVLVAVLVLFSIGTFRSYAETNREPWDKVAQLLEEQAGQGAMIVVHASWCLEYGVGYYLDREDLECAAFPGHKGEVTAEDMEALGRMVKGHDDLWLVYSHAQPGAERIIEFLNEKYDMERQESYFMIDVYHFVVRGAARGE